MGRRYIIDEIHAKNWMARLRDRETGDVIEVPLDLGGLWPKPHPEAPRSEASDASNASNASDSDSAAPAPPSEPAAPPAEPPAERTPRKPRSEAKGMARVTEPEALKEVMSSPGLRSIEIDESTLSPEDAEAHKKMRSMMRRARGKRAGKRGDLGWDETTDAGRSGLISRFGAGAFKILHASGDTYALFFEWDDGRYDRLGCGAADDMMNLANKRAQEDPPEPPPSHLTLELARLYCGNAEQKASAMERLGPAIAQIDGPYTRPKPPPTAEKDDGLVKSLDQALKTHKAKNPDSDLDRRLSESLKAALADLDATEERERKERGE